MEFMPVIIVPWRPALCLEEVLIYMQTQLRSQVLSKLQKRECLLHHTPDSESALWLSVLNSLVQQHLASSNYHYTLSVFQPEAGLHGQHSFGHKDIMQIMQIEPSTPLFKAIAEGGTLAVAGMHSAMSCGLAITTAHSMRPYVSR